MKHKLWVDFHQKRYLFILFLVLFLIYGIIAVHQTFDTLPKLGMVLPLVPFLLLILFFRIKLCYINKMGIRIGNAPNGEYCSIILNKAKFFTWEKIKEIRIYNKAVKQPLMLDYQSFLLLKTKDNNQYESFIADPKGFIKAISALEKSNLFSKNSKYVKRK